MAEKGASASPRERVLGVDGGQSGIRPRHALGDRVVEVAGVIHQEGSTTWGAGRSA